MATIKISIYELEIIAQEKMQLPPFKGSTLRGGFGSVFKSLTCTTPGLCKKSCRTGSQCPYGYIFETPVPAKSEIMRKYPHAPHPFIIEPPADQRTDFVPGDKLTFRLILIGRAIDYLPYFIYTFAELGNRGIGKGRAHYILSQVRALDSQGKKNLIYSSDNEIMQTGGEIIRVDLSSPSPEKKGNMAITFLTPLRLQYEQGIEFSPEFHALFRSLLRRISLLAYFHQGIELDKELDFKGLIQSAEKIKTLDKRYRPYRWNRYSNRQEKSIQMDGIIGEGLYQGDFTPFLPFLKLGEWIHLGKSTAFGMGLYRLAFTAVKMNTED
jgi:CRISPR-associated endoribonuclease Cas6